MYYSGPGCRFYTAALVVASREWLAFAREQPSVKSICPPQIKEMGLDPQYTVAVFWKNDPEPSYHCAGDQGMCQLMYLTNPDRPGDDPETRFEQLLKIEELCLFIRGCILSCSGPCGRLPIDTVQRPLWALTNR